MSTNNIKAVRGFNDILPNQSRIWGAAEDIMRHTLQQWGYGEIRLPIMERTELFCRTIGENTDIVGKEMYSFADKGDESVTLRPEGTAGVVRAYVENRIYSEMAPQKLWYMGPMFRYERPQKGRYRQFHQLGVEIFGETSALVDAESIALGYTILQELGVAPGIQVEINNIGCPACRPSYRDALVSFLRQYEGSLCSNCVERIDKNPLRVLDCKRAECREIVAPAPTIDDYRCEDCCAHYSTLQNCLEHFGVPFTMTPFMVRGLDYYVGTAFEYTTTLLGSQNAIGGGGRYDRLVKDLGGPDTPAVGFALGMERVMLLVEHFGSLATSQGMDYFIGYTAEAYTPHGLRLLQHLRQRGYRCEIDSRQRSAKNIFKRGHRLEAKQVVLIGDDEASSQRYMVKNMESSQQDLLALDDIGTR
ncbi:histidine--tRNA ligase [Desulfurispira natronophila]|uniref:Histidine--tRNA ligase n=1 Tax=Desulfurispira natronophila TaxID=682562 RepID=A0A7W8DGA9_9BACT|nr:histidine--tRNA ligase [Desulfurispira natronophila]MBB5021225.1 histidyl-tRNA synthetase [Desulfurispira natronophila]